MSAINFENLRDGREWLGHGGNECQTVKKASVFVGGESRFLFFRFHVLIVASNETERAIIISCSIRLDGHEDRVYKKAASTYFLELFILSPISVILVFDSLRASVMMRLSE